MARRGFSNTASTLSLFGTLDGVSATNSITLTAAPTGWPSTLPYFAVVDPGTASEEVVSVTAASGTSMTITRGSAMTTPYGSATKSHQNGALIKHVASAADYDEANAHVNVVGAAHGTSSALVGLSDVQTLSNKTLTTPTIGSFVNATHTHTAAASGGVLAPAATPGIPSRVFTNSGPVTATTYPWFASSVISGGASNTFAAGPGGQTLMTGSTVVGGTNVLYSGTLITANRVFAGTYAEYYAKVIPATVYGGTGTFFQFGIGTTTNTNDFSAAIDSAFFRVDCATGAVTVGARANSVSQAVTPIALPTLTANAAADLRVQIPVAGGTVNFFVGTTLVATVASTRAFAAATWQNHVPGFVNNAGSTGTQIGSVLFYLAVADI